MPLVIPFRARNAIRRITALTCFAVFASTGAALRSLSSPAGSHAVLAVE